MKKGLLGLASAVQLSTSVKRKKKPNAFNVIKEHRLDLFYSDFGLSRETDRLSWILGISKGIQITQQEQSRDA